MSTSFEHQFDGVFKGKTQFKTGIFIDNQFYPGSNGTTIDIVNPSTGDLITKISEGTAQDVDRAVEAAHRAFNTSWGLHATGTKRAELMNKLGNLMQQHAEELAALEALDNGKTYSWASNADVPMSIECIKYYAGYADKIHGKTIETNEQKLAYTRHEPIGVVGQIIPWNFPLLMMAWKLGPALATGNCIVMKPSEITPLTALFMASLIAEAGFPPGVVNIVVGYGETVGNAISAHMKIDKVAFTGSTLVGRKVMESAAKSNLKKVTLELGGKSPNVIFDDCDLDQAVNWAAHGVFFNHGQTCCAGSRVFVQEGIYDQFLQKFTNKVNSLKVGDPFHPESVQGPQVSKTHFERIMGYIDSGKEQGATVHAGGERHGDKGFFIQPTIFTDVHPDMKIVREEIFGPVGVLIKFKDEDDVVRQANDTMYGLAAAVFSKDIQRALNVAHRLQAGTVWVNCVNQLHSQVPFGGYKQSGIGRELGEDALANYVNVKAVHVNLGQKM